MFWKKWFQKDTLKGQDPLKDMTLAKMRVGWFVDWDDKTWEVAAYSYYDWGGGDLSYEWQLKSADETIYLELESDDEDFWSVSRKLDFGALGTGIRDHILEHEDPPEEVIFNGKTYYLASSSGGKYYKDGIGPARELLAWDYADDADKHYLTIEQWGEKDFDASLGEPVKEYQFTHILPREQSP